MVSFSLVLFCSHLDEKVREMNCMQGATAFFYFQQFIPYLSERNELQGMDATHPTHLVFLCSAELLLIFLTPIVYLTHHLCPSVLYFLTF
jgi:hypothetical protein